jgi:hypothetical protein
MWCSRNQGKAMQEKRKEKFVSFKKYKKKRMIGCPHKEMQ